MVWRNEKEIAIGSEGRKKDVRKEKGGEKKAMTRKEIRSAINCAGSSNGWRRGTLERITISI